MMSKKSAKLGVINRVVKITGCETGSRGMEERGDKRGVTQVSDEVIILEGEMGSVNTTQYGWCWVGKGVGQVGVIISKDKYVGGRVNYSTVDRVGLSVFIQLTLQLRKLVTNVGRSVCCMFTNCLCGFAGHLGFKKLKRGTYL